MSLIKVNPWANVSTGDDAKGYRSPGRDPKPEITIPRFRARLSIIEAQDLVAALLEAVAVAEKEIPE